VYDSDDDIPLAFEFSTLQRSRREDDRQSDGEGDTLKDESSDSEDSVMNLDEGPGGDLAIEEELPVDEGIRER